MIRRHWTAGVLALLAGSLSAQLAEEDITGGRGGSNYCPGNNKTRGQMAVFIVLTFGLQ